MSRRNRRFSHLRDPLILPFCVHFRGRREFIVPPALRPPSCGDEETRTYGDGAIPYYSKRRKSFILSTSFTSITGGGTVATGRRIRNSFWITSRLRLQKGTFHRKHGKKSADWLTHLCMLNTFSRNCLRGKADFFVSFCWKNLSPPHFPLLFSTLETEAKKKRVTTTMTKKKKKGKGRRIVLLP